MAPYKRSDPKKLAQERAAIAADQESREPSLISKIVGDVKKRINIRRQRQRGYGPPPRVKGAMQHGFKEYRDT